VWRGKQNMGIVSSVKVCGSQSFQLAMYLRDTTLQINLQKCAAKHAWMTTAMSASRHSIEKAAAKSMPRSL
jgi:hypothetical protein